MAYINELGQTIGCTVTNAERFTGLLDNWSFIIIPLLSFIGIYFLLIRHIKSKKIRVAYIIIATTLIILWIGIMWFGLICA